MRKGYGRNTKVGGLTYFTICSAIRPISINPDSFSKSRLLWRVRGRGAPPQPTKNHCLIVGIEVFRNCIEGLEPPFVDRDSSPTSLHKLLTPEKNVDLYMHLENTEDVEDVVAAIEVTGVVLEVTSERTTLFLLGVKVAWMPGFSRLGLEGGCRP